MKIIKFEVSPFKTWASIEFFNFRMSYSWVDHGKPYICHLGLLKKIRICFGRVGEIIITY